MLESYVRTQPCFLTSGYCSVILKDLPDVPGSCLLKQLPKLQNLLQQFNVKNRQCSPIHEDFFMHIVLIYMNSITVPCKEVREHGFAHCCWREFQVVGKRTHIHLAEKNAWSFSGEKSGLVQIASKWEIKWFEERDRIVSLHSRNQRRV